MSADSFVVSLWYAYHTTIATSSSSHQRPGTHRWEVGFQVAAVKFWEAAVRFQTTTAGEERADRWGPPTTEPEKIKI
jgi:hypothetical protein